ncbi:efflux RND transporter periplasmic adaptor subunit [Sphingomonas sp. MMS24-J13]|uniref:efflux RND transporter periplasmic adaptor subunit n=1 Tax=Sphingomonas sp. MMS24-J13 TaxID=3238686 RepID=UPI00384A5322
MRLADTGPEALYVTWLRLQCELIAGAHAGLLVLQQSKTSAYQPFAAWPTIPPNMTALAAAAERALNERTTIIIDESAAPEDGTVRVRPHIIFAQPIGAAERQFPLGAIVLAIDERAAAQAGHPKIAQQLHWGAGWIEAMEWRRVAQDNQAESVRLAEALELIAVGGEQARLDGYALALANELATHFACSRVAIGTRRRDHLQLTALSHAAAFDRRSQLVSAIENAMDEALHQKRTIAEPVVAAGDGAVIIAHKELIKRSGAGSVASVILPGRETSAGAITLEREAATGFSEQELRMLETAAALIGPVLELHIQSERWIAGRSAALFNDYRNRLFGPNHPTFKLVAAAIGSLLLLSLIVPGHFRIGSRSLIEGKIQRNLVAPFDGFIASAPVRAGDIVHAGDMLARLDDRDATLEQARWTSERETLVARYSDALARHDRSGLTILSAQIEQADAQLSLAQDRLARTRVTAPFTGIVVSGDLSQVLGSPVEKGKTLFTIAPLDRYRVIVQVDERDIRYIKVGATGRVVLAGMPSEALPITVAKITPLATSEDGRNYFRVEGTLANADNRLRPGMEGVARVDVGYRPLLWIWTRSAIDWIRISLWKWLP